MLRKDQFPKAYWVHPLVRFAGTLALAAGAFGFQSLFTDRLSDRSTAYAQSNAVSIARQSDRAPAVLWHDPSTNKRGDLFYGPGGAAHQPDEQSPFTFVREDLSGSHPKFEVRDDRGVRWKVKLGTEARPETVATRLVWAAGYSADEDYFVDEIHVDGMPARLHRGQRLVEGNGIVRNVRLKRMLEERTEIGTWAWRKNPFSGTRELNGLRVLMAVMNNWDVKDVNNSVYVRTPADSHEVPDARVFEVKDLGSTFGSTGLERTDHANGRLRSYRGTPFITRLTAETVSFDTPRRPDWIVLANTPEFLRRMRLLWIGRDIPRSDAKWMGDVLAQIPRSQIRDAFQAAGYAPDEVDGFTAIFEARIQQLSAL
jgi:hypothetical protein